MTTSRDIERMAAALRLAEKGIYTSRPNPCVGCIITNTADEVIGSGYHQCAGQAHAEINALNGLEPSVVSGSTVYVTLEPCNHFGKTPPCVDALIAARVGRVVCASEDPNPRVAGQGLQKLREAGIPTDVGVLQEQAIQLNRGFFRRMQCGRPWVTSKSAMSLDGCTALANGESKWITGEAARADVQSLRGRHGAILTGIGTILQDNPSLNVRALENDALLPNFFIQPIRAIVDARLQIPLQAKVFDGPGQCIVYTLEQKDAAKVTSLKTLGVEVVCLEPEAAHSRVPLQRVLADLAQREVNDVLIEAGPTLIGSAIEQRLLDEMVVYMAPHLMGSGGRPLFRLEGIAAMVERIPLSVRECRRVGEDFRFVMGLEY